jgi:hypothetical protein
MGRTSWATAGRLLVLGTLAAAALAACTDDRVPGGAPEAPAEATNPPSALTTEERVLTIDGVGPYQIGAHVDDLVADGLIGEVSPVDTDSCPDLAHAEAAGPYLGTLVLTLRSNELVEIGTAGGEPIRTPEGFGVGTPIADLELAYGERGAPVQDSAGTAGYVATVGDRVLLFAGSQQRPDEVAWLAVGLADYTERSFQTGAPC